MSPCGDRGVAGGNTYHYATANLVTAEPPGPLVGCLVAASPRRAENAAILERARSSGALCARWRSSAMQFQRRCARQRARTPLQPRARARAARRCTSPTCAPRHPESHDGCTRSLSPPFHRSHFGSKSKSGCCCSARFFAEVEGSLPRGRVGNLQDADCRCGASHILSTLPCLCTCACSLNMRVRVRLSFDQCVFIREYSSLRTPTSIKTI